MRQFAMEGKEQAKYAVTNIFRRILEQRLDSTKRICWGGIDAFFVGSELKTANFARLNEAC